MSKKSRRARSPSPSPEESASSSSSSRPAHDPVIMYIFVNRGLKMGTGKIAGQVGHAVESVVENKDRLDGAYREWYHEWKTAHLRTKIVLSATEDQMNEISLAYKSEAVFDAGRTQIAPHSFTALAVYPMPKSRTQFSSFSLL